MDLPEDIILNILLRLPLICFLRFKCVCKAWYSLLSDPIFMYKNLTFIDSDPDDDDDLQLLIHRRHRFTFNSYLSLISFHNINSPSDYHLPLPTIVEEITNNKDFIRLVGCCNGFDCLSCYCYNKILVWNPLTKETKVLPQPPYGDYYRFDDYFDYQPYEVGFCYDAEANDYKVITISHPAERTPGPSVVLLYSFSTNSWKHIDFSLRLRNFYTPPVNSDDGTFYHWLAEIHLLTRMEDEDVHDDCTIPVIILSFDMKLELFITTEIPYIRYRFKYEDPFVNFGFFMLKDYVAIFATPFEYDPPLEYDKAGAPIFEISVLVRIGVKESWIKLISFGPIAGARNLLWPWKNGNLFLETYKGDVMVFDTLRSEVVNLLPSDFPSSDIQIMTYKRTSTQLGAINIG